MGVVRRKKLKKVETDFSFNSHPQRTVILTGKIMLLDKGSSRLWRHTLLPRKSSEKPGDKGRRSAAEDGMVAGLSL